ncbi:MAG: NUDIX domain-containing protein [Ezakiella sp.]|uniref:NUDIX hydrolase n=1 Tax=Ezakiella sp. TaxID=1935205 RepID=UPI0029799492|nr:NUDIX domain-containing protein [Ezakiella sp.]MDD7731417.1 NUDIX domain-containing protein [Eubacteriales bacterium]MDY6079463.1 NUDIX domain-containing protein [Ezakiella sp.]
MDTTVCYIKRQKSSPEEFLFIYRNKKENDINHGKNIGIGGHIENDETPYQCNIREVYEETGLKLNSSTYLGLVIFSDLSISNQRFLMHVYFSDSYEGSENLPACTEGELNWLTVDEFLNRPHFEGDEYFLKYAFRGEFFGVVELVYNSNILTKIIHNGRLAKL